MSRDYQIDKTSFGSSKLLIAILFVISLSAIVCTIWIPDYLPFTDYPVHLALIQEAAGNTDVLDRFETNWWTPYALPYYFAALINRYLSIELTGKILLLLYFFMTPLITMRLLGSLDKPRYFGLAVFPLLLNFNLSWGFLPFLFSIPLMLESVNQTIRFIKSPSVYRWLSSALLFVILFFTHLFALLIALWLCLGMLAGSLLKLKPERKTIMLSLTSSIPSILLIVLWRISLNFSQSDMIFLKKGIRFSPVLTKLKYFPEFVISGDPGYTFRYIFGGIIILLLLCFIPGRSENNLDIKHKNSNSKVSFIGLSLFVSISLVYFICPYSLLTAVWLFNRLAFLIPLLFLTILPANGLISEKPWSIAIVLLTVTLSCTALQRHISFSNESRLGIDVIQQIPSDQTLRYIPSSARSRFCDHEPYEHFGQYYKILKNGFVFNPFATLVHIPIRYSDRWLKKFEGFQPGAMHSKNQLITNLRFDSHDYFLLRRSPEDTPENIAALFRRTGKPVPNFICQNGPWILLKKQELNCEQ